MWIPRTWTEIEALLGEAIETASLDFKRKLGSSDEVAKDIAAMSLNGGVLIYGIDEDPETLTATRIEPVAFKGAEERIRQIAASNIAPPCELEVEIIRKAEGDSAGAIAVRVPESLQAPH